MGAENADLGVCSDGRDAGTGLAYTWQQESTQSFDAAAAARIAYSAVSSSGSGLPSQQQLFDLMGGQQTLDAIERALNRQLGYSDMGTCSDIYCFNIVAIPMALSQLQGDMIYAIGRRSPLVVHVKDGFPGSGSTSPSHFVVVVGYEDGGNTAFVADPSSAMQNYCVSTAELAAWMSDGYVG